MNIWNIGILALIAICFFGCLCIVIDANNWFFVMGLVASTLAAFYFLGEV